MITLFSIRPRGFNVGNDTIFLGVRHLLREAFGGRLNIVQIPATVGDDKEFGGLRSRTIHEMNLYGHGVVVGGGNLYENGQLDVDVNALQALRPPMMLFSVSHGRIYDNRHQLVRRSDAMPDSVVRALDDAAAISVARDDATLAYLRGLGLDSPFLGGCPTLLLDEVPQPLESDEASWDGCLISVRNPRLMNVPLQDQARVRPMVAALIESLTADGFGPVALLCHDTRDLSFASSFPGVEYFLSDDVYSHLRLLRKATLVVSFRLHAYLPCLSFGTPAINISYDERSRSLVRTIGMEGWDIDMIRSNDVVSAVRDRCRQLPELTAIAAASRPRREALINIMRSRIREFATLVCAFAAEEPGGTPSDTLG